MEMAKYIMSIFRTNLPIVWSWGFHNPVAIDNGLQFKVEGFKYQGDIEVVYDEGWDLFNVRFVKSGKLVETVEGVYFDGLIDTIDEYVERVPDYDKKVQEFLNS